MRRSGFRLDWHSAGLRAAAAATLVAAVLNVITALLESLARRPHDTLVAVRQSTGQGGDDFVVAAAAVPLGLLSNRIRGCHADPLVGIVQTVDERAHDLGIAGAVVLAQLPDRLAAALGMASRLRFIDPVRHFARIGAALLLAAAVAALGRS